MTTRKEEIPKTIFVGNIIQKFRSVKIKLFNEPAVEHIKRFVILNFVKINYLTYKMDDL